MISVLTPRQLVILQLAAGGASNPEIALALGIEVSTVKNHLCGVAVRYGLRRGRTALVMEGILRGDVDELRAFAELEGRRRCEGDADERGE